jgi:hypothetical protein
MLYHVVGRNKNSLRSHALVFLSQQPAAMAVPRKIEPSEYYVVFAKLSDSEVACEEKNRLLVRRQVTGLLIPLYRAGIDTYENVPENIGYFAAGEDERVLPLRRRVPFSRPWWHICRKVWVRTLPNVH